MWALLPEEPQEALTQITDQVIVAEARADPIAARRNWGRTEEQRARAAPLESENEPAPADIDPRLRGGGPDARRR